MPACKEIEKLLSDFLDRELAVGQCLAVEEHLDSCPDCRQAADTLKKTIEICRKHRSEQRPGALPPDKEQELKEALRKSLDRQTS
jgi:predicted anti-sigma-YlaC factor YlaD